MSIEEAERARALVGTRFRAQGRSEVTGLDCVGLAMAVFGVPVGAVRRDYRLRGDHRRELATEISRFLRPVRPGACRAGDLMLAQVTSDQLHLLVLTDEGFVHADARLGRVVETPGAPPWTPVAVYRRRVRGRGC